MEGERPPPAPPGEPETSRPGTGRPGPSAGEPDDKGKPGANGSGAGDAGSAGPGKDRPGKARPDKARRGAGRNLPISIGVGLALGAMVLLSLYTGVKEIFLAVLVLFLAVGAWELTRALGTTGIRVPLIPLGIGGITMLVLAYTSGAAAFTGAFGLTVVAVLVWRMPQGPGGYVRDTTAGLFTVMYVPFLAGFAALMLAPSDGADRIVTFIAITVASDIGGFFVGAFLGRHKMVPAISPKKTWEGFAGSALTCMLIGALLLPLLLGGRFWQGIVLGAAVVCSATLGDLIESMIKRDLGVKDMGRLLPEHGGVMDRLDSLLATAPIVWLGLQLFVPA